MLLVYFAAGVFFLAWQQEWHISTALYVVVQIITTIGCGFETKQDMMGHHGACYSVVSEVMGMSRWKRGARHL